MDSLLDLWHLWLRLVLHAVMQKLFLPSLFSSQQQINKLTDFWLMKMQAFSAWCDRVSSYRDCMHVWKTWMAFDEVTPVSTMLFSISTRSRYYIAVQLHLLECFVIHYTSSACWGSEWAEKGSACGWHVLHLLKASNIIRAYKESCLPSQGHCLFRLLICLLLCTDFNKIINYVQKFYSIA